MVMILSEDDVSSALDMSRCLETVETALKDPTLKNFVDNPSMRYNIKEENGFVSYSPMYLPKHGILALKMVTVYEDNPKRFNKPVKQSRIILQDIKNGEILAVMSSNIITAVRTGALSAIATRHLSLEASAVAGIFGAGIHGKTHLRALSKVRNLEAAYVYDKNQHASERFREEMQKELGLDIIIANNPTEVIERSEIIVAATSSSTPVFDGSMLRSGMHINAVGSKSPDRREIDDSTVSHARIIVDSKSNCLKTAGDLIIPMNKGIIGEEHIVGELSDIITGKTAGRVNTDDITLFKAVEMPYIDGIIASQIYTDARKSNKGKKTEL